MKTKETFDISVQKELAKNKINELKTAITLLEDLENYDDVISKDDFTKFRSTVKAADESVENALLPW